MATVFSDQYSYEYYRHTQNNTTYYHKRNTISVTTSLSGVTHGDTEYQARIIYQFTRSASSSNGTTKTGMTQANTRFTMYSVSEATAHIPAVSISTNQNFTVRSTSGGQLATHALILTRPPYGSTANGYEVVTIYATCTYTSNSKSTVSSGGASNVIIGTVQVPEQPAPPAPTGAKMKAKVSGAWVEGDVKVKANGAWVDADKIYVKVNGTWVESD